VLASQIGQGITPLLSTVGTLATLENDDKVVVSDLPENIARIEQAITQLDIPRPQVRIWALIYDAGLEDLEACGVNFQSGINGSALAATGDAAQSIMMNSVTAPVGSPTNGVLTLSTINRLGMMQSVIQALDTSNDSRLLADPNVVVMDHEQAQIEIVTEVPYQQLTQGIDGGQIGTTEFREAGVTLLVTPHIAGDNTIAMQVNPRFSLLTGFTEGDNAPIIDRRETNTTVRIANLETLVLGGLRQRTRIVEKSGIPGLSKVPYLGHLFKFDRRTARESELIVFITPEIVTPHYRGNCREECIRDNVRTEIELTPTSPIPFGMEVLRAEKAAANARLNTFKPNSCECGQCANCFADPGIIGGYGVEQR
jgi:general secretion pathway protein D